jgi:hypothetical protein
MRDTTKRALDAARVEKDVENAYRAEVSYHRPSAEWESPFGTDGEAKWGTVRLLLEAKYAENLKDRASVCGVLGQMILYLKKFEDAGTPLPNVLLMADRNECLVLSTASVRGFLEQEIDWSVAPSTGSPELTRALVQGVNILPYAHDIDSRFDFRLVLHNIETLAEGEKSTVRASKKNIESIFLYWKKRVFAGEGDEGLTPVQQVDVFLLSLFQPLDVFPHPSRPGVLVVPGYPGGVKVDVEQYRSFFSHFVQGYRPSEVEGFMAMKDRMVEDEARRFQGAFFTPSLWVEEAHTEVAKALGENWREECIVWDCAAGTANMTRDYDWGELISSTAEKPDVTAMKAQGWGGKHVFQYDFLNHGEESPFFEEGQQNLLPHPVHQALTEAAAAGKRLVFFMNPPYGTAGIYRTYETDKEQERSTLRSGIAKTAVNGKMREEKLGAPSQQLYAQFMYRCDQLSREYGFGGSTIALFSVPTFMSSGSYKKFRDWWYAQRSHVGGFLFRASHFSGVSGRWGVAFTVWDSGGTTDSTAVLPLRLTTEKNFGVVTEGIKQVYNSDGKQASKWVRDAGGKLKGSPVPQLSSGLRAVEGGTCTLPGGSFGFMADKGNCLMYSNDETYLLSSGSSRNRGFATGAGNWRQAMALFGARKLVGETWATQKDEYLAPDETLPLYNEWVNDCHIYALIHRHNNGTAMRRVPYASKLWRIKNHWFWLTQAEAEALLDSVATPNCWRDCKKERAGDPYLSTLRENGSLNLSPDARYVLTLLENLWKDSLVQREAFYAGRPIDDKHPDLHLYAWDAGVYQLKHLWRALYPERWEALKAAHKVLAERLKEGVYTYGFLKR